MLETPLTADQKKRDTLEKFCRGEIRKEDMLQELDCTLFNAFYRTLSLRLEPTRFHPDDLAEEIRKSDAFFETCLSDD